MKKFSLTYIGNIVLLLSFLSELLGLNIAPGELETAVNVIVALVGGVLVFVGRWKAGGVNVFGVKK